MFTGSKSFKKLSLLKKSFKPSLAKLFAKKDRADRFSISTDRLHYDFSRQLIDEKILSSLASMAKEAKLKEKISAMFSGKRINVTENRAVLHVALRNISNKPITVDGKDVMPEVNAVPAKIEKFSSDV